MYLDDASEPVGYADVTLPDIQAMTETIKGAGIAGEIDAPVIGQFQSMETEINWNTVCAGAMRLNAPVTSLLTCRGSQQVYDIDSGRSVTKPLTVVMKIQPKGLGLGKLEAAAKTDTSSKYEVFMVKVLIEGREWLLLDKVAYIFRVDKEDYLEGVRGDMGII